MKMAGLLANTRRGVFRITERGQEVLKKKPAKIDLRFLRQLPEYQDAREKHKQNPPPAVSSTSEDQERMTPAERLEEAYQILR